MKTITTRGTSAPAESVAGPSDAVVLSGPPYALHGRLALRNQTDEKVYVRDVALRAAKGKKSAQFKDIGADRLTVRARLAGRESRMHDVHFALGAQTPPGTYEAVMSVGGKDVALQMIVHSVVDVELSPRRLYFVGVQPGRTHTAEVLLLNRGNVPVVVPSVRHGTTMDLDLVCRSVAQAIRSHGEEGSEATLDAVVRNVANDLADWIGLSIENAGTAVAPGDATLMQISMTMPEDVHTDRMYEGEIRIYDQHLSYLIVPEADQDGAPESSR